MDKIEAREYASKKKEEMELKNRISRLESKIRQLEQDGIVSDSVTGTRKDGTIGSIRISGIQSSSQVEAIRDLRVRKIRAKALKEILEMDATAFEEYVYAIDNSRIRRMISLKYIDELTWQQVASKIGKGYTADSCRITVNRFFKEKK